MNIEELRDYCLTFKGVEESFPFDEETLVFKVQNKVFCLTGIERFDRINVKCDPERAVELREQYSAVIPGYHMNKKHWNSLVMDGTLDSSFIKEQVAHSYELIVSALPKKLRKELDELEG